MRYRRLQWLIATLCLRLIVPAGRSQTELMKIPPLSVVWLPAIAVCLLCFGLFQACETTPQGPEATAQFLASDSACQDRRVACWPKPVYIKPRGLDDDASADARKMAFVGKLRNARKYGTWQLQFCKRRGHSGSDCKGIGHEVESLVSAVQTTGWSQASSQPEQGGVETEPDAIHVTQNIFFETETGKLAFFAEMGLNPDGTAKQ